MGRANVTVLEYPNDGRAPSRRDFKMASSLQDHIDKLDRGGGADTKLRLFVVEDLSREVIETLGAHYDVDPLFFREHLVDYVWYNISTSLHLSGADTNTYRVLAHRPDGRDTPGQTQGRC